MVDYPQIIYKEDKEKSKSNAEHVKGILERIYNFRGEPANEYTFSNFQYELEYLTGYVTLIMTDTIIDTNWAGKPVEKLLYFFNEDVAYLLRLQLELQNRYSSSLLDNIRAMYRNYKWYCYMNNRCLVYEYNPLTDEYEIDDIMSNPEQLPAVYSVRDRNFENNIMDGI